jgi:hypothetical protein
MSDERTPQGKPEGTPDTVQYFYFLSASYSRELPRPIVERVEIPGGYQLRERTHETAKTYNGGTFRAPAGEIVTRSGTMTRAMNETLAYTNKDRIEKGMGILFEIQDMHVAYFDCGRNEL